jgi:hypothetical protein
MEYIALAHYRFIGYLAINWSRPLVAHGNRVCNCRLVTAVWSWNRLGALNADARRQESRCHLRTPRCPIVLVSDWGGWSGNGGKENLSETYRERSGTKSAADPPAAISRRERIGNLSGRNGNRVDSRLIILWKSGNELHSQIAFSGNGSFPEMPRPS